MRPLPQLGMPHGECQDRRNRRANQPEPHDPRDRRSQALAPPAHRHLRDQRLRDIGDRGPQRQQRRHIAQPPQPVRMVEPDRRREPDKDDGKAGNAEGLDDDRRKQLGAGDGEQQGQGGCFGSPNVGGPQKQRAERDASGAKGHHHQHRGLLWRQSRGQKRPRQRPQQQHQRMAEILRVGRRQSECAQRPRRVEVECKVVVIEINAVRQAQPKPGVDEPCRHEPKQTYRNIEANERR